MSKMRLLIVILENTVGTKFHCIKVKEDHLKVKDKW